MGILPDPQTVRTKNKNPEHIYNKLPIYRPRLDMEKTSSKSKKGFHELHSNTTLAQMVLARAVYREFRIALAAALAQSTRFHPQPNNLTKETPKTRFGEAQA